MSPAEATTVAASTPAPPAHLPAAAKKQWSDTHAKALAQAKRDYPDSERAQRGHALKSANAMLAVPAPQSADDIDALEPWQVLHRATRTFKNTEGEEVTARICTTSDGRKYSFPVNAEKAEEGPAGKGKRKSADETGK
jgi:hypothetical protein